MKRLVFLLALAAPLVVYAKGSVNWEGQVLKATGSGAPDMKATNPAQARLGAERAAQMDAFRNLLAQAKGIQITADRTVGDELARDEIRGKLEGVIRGYKITAKRYFSDSGVEIDVEVPLAALAEVLVDPAAQIFPVKTEGKLRNTGLVVDATGLKVVPVLAPRLLDEAGKPLYGGSAAYVDGVAAGRKHARVGDRPLVVKATRAQGTDLVLSADEAKKLSDANNTWLSEGRVVIVTRIPKEGGK
ncbi:MAG: hypothetical protein WBV82_19310 [Myxococcaceae bacterium]